MVPRTSGGPQSTPPLALSLTFGINLAIFGPFLKFLNLQFLQSSVAAHVADNGKSRVHGDHQVFNT